MLTILLEQYGFTLSDIPPELLKAILLYDSLIDKIRLNANYQRVLSKPMDSALDMIRKKMQELRETPMPPANYNLFVYDYIITKYENGKTT